MLPSYSAGTKSLQYIPCTTTRSIEVIDVHYIIESECSEELNAGFCNHNLMTLSFWIKYAWHPQKTKNAK